MFQRVKLFCVRLCGAHQRGASDKRKIIQASWKNGNQCENNIPRTEAKEKMRRCAGPKLLSAERRLPAAFIFFLHRASTHGDFH
jgi:hypothetical protein